MNYVLNTQYYVLSKCSTHTYLKYNGQYSYIQPVTKRFTEMEVLNLIDTTEWVNNKQMFVTHYVKHAICKKSGYLLHIIKH